MRNVTTMKKVSLNEKTLLLLASLLVGFSANGAEGYRMRRVSGGTLVIPGEFKYLVAIVDGGSLDNGGRQICGGAIISERHILTVGHCVEGDHSLTVVTEITDLRDYRQDHVHKISNVILHPDYNLVTKIANYDPDIALIVLAQRLTLTATLRKVFVPHFQVRSGNTGIFAGWGDIGPNRESSPHLQKMRVTFLDQNMCEEKKGNYAADKICGYQWNATACGGDSGSPLVFGQFVVGIASASWCVIGEAHTYVNVFYYRDWILETMKYNT